MKTIADIFDIVFLLVILGIMLPFLFSSVNTLTDDASYGFEVQDDKTMKLNQGDVYSISNDSYTAADVILMLKTANTEKLSYCLPNGTIIKVNEDYNEKIDYYTALARSCLDSTKRYSVKYDYTAGVWRIN